MTWPLLSLAHSRTTQALPTMCTDANNDYLNKLHACGKDGAKTLTLEYAAYMN